MIKRTRILLAALCFGMLAGLHIEFVPFAPQPAKADPVGAPGAEHKRLNALIGEWTTDIKTWKTHDGEPIALKGTATRRWVLDGRFVEERAENETSRAGRFRSTTYLGYNRRTKLYQRFWITNTSTGMFTERGRYDPDANHIQTEGSEVNPISGAVILTTSVLKIDSPSRHVFTAYATGANGVRWKQLEIVYSKK